MAISQADIKLLWGRAGGRCSFPGCGTELIQDAQATVSTFAIGEQAHIVAREPNGPRGMGALAVAERDSYANLVLLCPTHHRLIDRNPEDFPVERLYFMKVSHELWVQQSLATPKSITDEVDGLIYANLVDAAAKHCEFQTWSIWASNLLGHSHKLDGAAPQRVMSLRAIINRAVWPGTNIELENALHTLLVSMSGVMDVYGECSKVTPDGYEADRFYKGYGYNDNYDRDLRTYLAWEESLEEWVYDATKAANWVADVVRRDINATFYAVEGRFYLEVEPDMSMRWKLPVPQFSEAERRGQPALLSTKLADVRSRRDSQYRHMEFNPTCDSPILEEDVD